VETNLERCPTCGSELSQTKFREIRAKLRDEQERKAAEIAEAKSAITRELEREFTLQLEQQKRDAQKRAKEIADQQVQKVTAERDLATARLKAAEAREDEIRRQAQLEIDKQKKAAEKQVKAEAESAIRRLTVERDQATRRLKAAEEREAVIRAQALEEAEKARQKELQDQRQVLESDKKLALLKLQSEFNRERDGYRKKTQLLETQLQRKTANELGDGAEIDVFESIRDSFDGSGGKTTRIPKGQSGADILHEVFYKGASCGRIIIEDKNRQVWQNVFVTKLRQDQVEASAEHAILTTTAFPAGKKEMCIESGVIVISPARAVYLVQLLRQAMITMHVKGLSLQERADKMSRLYGLITSDSYNAKFAEANRLAQDLLQLDVQEKTSHDNVWKKRGALVKRVQSVLREVETDVQSVIEGSRAETHVLPLYDKKGAAAGSAS
jgi:hypothetical protein